MATRRRKSGPKTPSYSEEETREALMAFNAAVARQDSERREAKRKSKADRARKEAADAVKRVNADPRSTPEERAAAEQTYRDAVEAWGRIDRGEPDPPDDDTAGDAAASEADDATDSDTAVTDDATDSDTPETEETAEADEPQSTSE